MPSSTKRKSSTATRIGTRRTSWGPARSASRNTSSGNRSRGCAIPIITTRDCRISTALSASYADKQATRVSAIKGDRAAIEFRGFPPATRDELVGALGDQITVQESDWNCGNPITPNHKRKPFDDVRVRRALTLAIDRWRGAPAMSKISVHADGRRRRLSRLAAGRDQGGIAAAGRLLARYREIAGRGAAAAEGSRGRRA